MQAKLLGIITVDFDVTDELLIRYSAVIRFWIRNGNTVFMYFKNTCNLGEKYCTILSLNLVYLWKLVWLI